MFYLVEVIYQMFCRGKIVFVIQAATAAARSVVWVVSLQKLQCVWQLFLLD
jgi:hypothetical protein